MPPLLLPSNVHTDNTRADTALEETYKARSSVWGHAAESTVPWNLWGKRVSHVGEAHTLISDQALCNQGKSSLFYTRGVWEIVGSFQETMEAYRSNGGILSSRSYSLTLCMEVYVYACICGIYFYICVCGVCMCILCVVYMCTCIFGVLCVCCVGMCDVCVVCL